MVNKWIASHDDTQEVIKDTRHVKEDMGKKTLRHKTQIHLPQGLLSPPNTSH